MARRRSASFFIYTGSVAFHMALAIGAVALPKPKRTETVAITMTEAKKKPAPPKEDAPKPAPPPPPPAAPSKAKAAPSLAPAPTRAAEAPPPPSDAPAAAAGDGFADLGLAMSNGPGGIAVAGGPRGAATAALAPSATTTRKVTALAPKATDACDEAPVKAKPRSIVKPVLTEEAKAAQVEGVVRVEITIDAEGRVIQARILRGLGHGLDEAALAAARQMTFEPGTRCGKASVTTLAIGMRFALGS